MPRLRIYKASAGSGKTFRLVREYLQIVFADPSEYKHVLGVTFTNKSTAEMKSRILKELVKLAEGQSSGHREAMMELLGKDEAFVRNRARLILHFILHDYSHYSISTIDSFFQKLIRSFARDIGLSAGYNLEMDVAFVLEESIERLIGELDLKNPATRWINEFALTKVREGKNWNFRKELKDLGREVFKEKFQLKETMILRLLEDGNRLTEIYRDLMEVKQGFEKKLCELGTRGRTIIGDSGLTLDDFNYKKASFAGIFFKYASGDIDPPTKRPREALDQLTVWCSKGIDDITKQKVEQAYHGGLNQTLSEILAYYDEHHRSYYTAIKCMEFFYQFVLVADIQKYIRQYRDEQDTMLISDTSAFIAQVMGQQDESFIFEKVGNYYHHYLIDEFQDTSVLQWNNFKPLLSNSISQDYVSMVVGDVKQSIYRFRNGDWRLLLYQAGKEMPYHEEVFLTHNYRSDARIIKFNNTLFDILPGLFSSVFQQSFSTPEEMNGTVGSNAAYFTEAYDHQEQQVPDDKREDSGYVQLQFVPCEEERTWRDLVMEKLPGMIDDILSRGFLASDIVLLVRDSKDASCIYDHLTNEMHAGRTKFRYDLLTERSLLLISSPAVRMIISAFYYLANTRDTLHKAQLKTEYYLYIEQMKDREKFHFVFGSGYSSVDKNDPMDEFFSRVASLQQLTLHELTTELIRLFRLHLWAGQILFLQSLQDALLDYMRDHEISLPAFLEWWELKESTLSIATPESSNAVWIMTIHKSKGLEFPVVIVPFCDWKIDHLGFHTNILWTSTAEPPFDKLPVVPVKYGSQLENTFFARDYADEKMAAYLDNLNLLYVALTRPVHELYICAEDKTRDTLQSAGDFLYAAMYKDHAGEDGLFLKFPEYWDQETQTLTIGEKQLHLPETLLEENFRFEHYVTKEHPVKIAIRRQAFDLYFHQPGMEEKIHKGNLVHEIFYRLDSWESLGGLLEQMLAEGKIDGAGRDQLTPHLKEVAALPEVKLWFDPSFRVYKERGIKGVSAATYVPDRIVMTGTETWVIDFKTGSEQDEHHRQVRNYIAILKEMGLPEVKGYLLYTAVPQVVEVITK